MSDFMDSEAEESDEEVTGKKKNVISSDDDEEEDEDDDAKIEEEMKDFIDNEAVDYEEESDSEAVHKRKHEAIDDQLEDEDYDLIEENLGIKVKRKQKRKRIRVLSDDEDSGKGSDAEGEKEGLATELFEDGDVSVRDDESVAKSRREPDANEFGDLDQSEEESDPDDFIVDDDGQPISKQKKKRHIIHSDAALQEAQDIFGVDFDFEEFDQYGDISGDEAEESDEYEEELDEETGEQRQKKSKAVKRSSTKKSIYEVYEPSELERGHFTDLDQEIRNTDMPERFQLRGIPVRPLEDGELEDEAIWIYEQAFLKFPISTQELNDQSEGPGTQYSNYISKRGPGTVNKIKDAINFMRNQHFEVPFIAFYRKEYVEPEMNIYDLWKVWHWDMKWTQLRTRKNNMLKLFEKMQQYQFEQNSDPEKPLASSFRALTEDDIERVKDVKTPEELKDVYQHFLLHYGQDLPKMKEFQVLQRRKERQEQRESRRKHRRERREKREEEIAKKREEKKARKEKAETARKISEDRTSDDEGDKDKTGEDDDGDKEKSQEGEDGEKEKEDDNDDMADKEDDEEQIEESESEVEEEEEEEIHMVKHAPKKTGYTVCVQAGLAAVSRRFGLTPEQFGENLRDNYQRNDVDQYPLDPVELATEYLCTQFPTPEDVLKGARHMVAMQLAYDPVVRSTVRDLFIERAKIYCRPTPKGMKEIDESHQCYTFKYLKNKPIKDLSGDQFLKLTMAVSDKQMTYNIVVDDELTQRGEGGLSYFEEIKPLYQKDEFSHLVQEWNNQRSQALERALTQILYPEMEKEVKNKLLDEAKECIVKNCTRKLYKCLKVAPYQADQQLDDDDEYLDSSRGLRVLGLAYSSERDEASFCVLVDGDGEVTDFMRLPGIMRRRDSWRAEEKMKKLEDIKRLKEFILTKKPHVIALAADNRDAATLVIDLKDLVSDLEQEHQFAPINVELVDNELARIFQNTTKAETDFREYPVLLRQAISVARRLQDPLIEFAQMLNADEDLLCLKLDPLQDQVSKEELLHAIEIEFINRVNEVGVDVNRCIAHQHTMSLIQFVCGLGPRKGYHLLKFLKQNNTRLENRTQLVTTCNMGPKVFINCAGFIKIDTNSLGDSTEAYVEVLDGSRVHPETYEWARKMAVDALEYDDTAEDANPAGALEEILESPERLKELDLEAFAEELERQGYGNKHITLYDIRSELNHRYKDQRTPYRSPTNEERFNMLVKETPQTFNIGKLITARVTGIARKRPQGEQLDQANPVRSDETGLWQCPFCQRNDFPELSEVWSHFDAGSCPGQSVGVKVRLDNTINGFVANKMLSDKKVSNPEDRVKVNMSIHARITKIDIDRFNVDLTCKSSDLLDKENKWRQSKDLYYDLEQEEIDRKKEEERSKQKARQTYVKRVIAHPSFRNIGYKECESLMNSVDQGDVIIRPSSKGSDHLTVTWKVVDGVLHHIDVLEEKKENAFSLGASLWIDGMEFEDLDEIIARYIQPLAALSRDFLNHPHYRDTEGGRRDIMEKLLYEEKKRMPSRIPYFFSASKELPGKFLLSYIPRNKVIHEYISVTPDGFRYRRQMFHALGHVIRWFKEHFRDPIPGTPGASLRTPLPAAGISATPLSLAGIDAATLQRAAAGLPYGHLSQVATPAGSVAGMSNYGGGNFGYHQPMTPMMTPFVTPSYQTPSRTPVATPSYQPTPRAQWPGTTPGRTPSQGRPPPSRGMVENTTYWGKQAEMWAKVQRRQRSRNSPNPMAGSPMTPADATPLIDE